MGLKNTILAYIKSCTIKLAWSLMFEQEVADGRISLALLYSTLESSSSDAVLCLRLHHVGGGRREKKNIAFKRTDNWWRRHNANLKCYWRFIIRLNQVSSPLST